MFILCVHHVCDPCTVFVAPYAMLFLCLEIRFSFILYVYIYIFLCMVVAAAVVVDEI